MLSYTQTLFLASAFPCYSAPPLHSALTVGVQESTSALEPLKVLPAATLKSIHKSKLPTTPSILKSDNQRKLKGYTTKEQAKKASHQVDAKALKPRYIRCLIQLDVSTSIYLSFEGAVKVSVSLYLKATLSDQHFLAFGIF